MTLYQKEIQRIRLQCFANEGQLAAVIRIRGYIDKHFERDLNLELLSRIGCTSKYHLLRLFKKYYGQTPGQYLTDRRIERSKAFLTTGLPVAQTCYAIGFESPASFSTLFRRKTGLSPREFQKKQFSQSLPGV